VIQEEPEISEMKWEGIARSWRRYFVDKLEDRYGLPEEEAREKVDAWLSWVKKQSDPKPQRPS
jgi:hypothetical protein